MKRSHITHSVFYLISILLLFGQLASVVHAADHPFHVEDEVCDIFVALEKTGDGLLDIGLPSLFKNVPTAVSVTILLTPANSKPRQHFPRAPPV